MIILEKKIFKLPGKNDENRNNLKWIEFTPKKEEIPKDVYYDELSEKKITFFKMFTNH